MEDLKITDVCITLTRLRI